MCGNEPGGGGGGGPPVGVDEEVKPQAAQAPAVR